MLRIDTMHTGVQQGDTLLFSDFQDGGEMWAGQGPREIRREIRFDEPFKRTPVVQISLSMFDMDNGANARMDLSTDAISKDRFQIVFKTWGDTRIARVRVAWIAFGPVGHEDDWDL